MKAQISFVEYIVSFSIFSVFVAYLFFRLLSYMPAYLNELRGEKLRSEAYQLSEFLINDLGEPLSWASLVGYWKFDEIAGIDAADSSGFGNDGTLINFDFTPESGWTSGCVIGSCLRFDGLNDYISIPSSPFLNSQEFTYEAWIKPLISTNEVYGPTLFMRETSAGDNVFLMRAGINRIGIGKITCEWPPDWWSVNYPFEEGKWYHVVCAASKTKREIYVNGSLVGEMDRTNGLDYSDAGRLFIGQDQDDGNPSDFFNGTIDNAKFYSVALSAKEIKTRYEAGAVGKEENFIKRIGLSSIENKTNYLSYGKVKKFAYYCTSNYDLVKKWIGADYQFLIAVSDNSGSISAVCIPPRAIIRGVNATIKRFVAFDTNSYGELTVYVW